MVGQMRNFIISLNNILFTIGFFIVLIPVGFFFDGSGAFFTIPVLIGAVLAYAVSGGLWFVLSKIESNQREIIVNIKKLGQKDNPEEAKQA